MKSKHTSDLDKQENKKKTVSTEVPLTPQNDEVQTTNSSFESGIDTSFFYTNDKFLNAFDDKDIFRFIYVKYPNLKITCTDSMIKRAILQLLDDNDFIERILDYYDLTVYDFIKKLYLQYGTIFKGQFIKKTKNVIEKNKYAKRTRHLSKKSN